MSNNILAIPVPTSTTFVDLQLIPTDLITPSPYQQRKFFSPSALTELVNSIARDGLIQPIVVRSISNGYELIAGERRWRATKQVGNVFVLARVVEATDLQARRMCAAENLQRQDLSDIETVEAIVEMVDAELLDIEDYLLFGNIPMERVRRLLSKLNADYANCTEHFIHKFMYKIETIFSNLPKPTEWRSFYNNDLPLITTIDEEVRQVAIEQKLNKSQARELDKLKKTAPETFQELLDTTHESTQQLPQEIITPQLPTVEDCQVAEEVLFPITSLREISAREIKVLRQKATETSAIVPIRQSSLGAPPALQMSESNEWYTPSTYVEAARALMGGIDLDPASNEFANQVIKAEKYYTIENNGFDKAWIGRVWLNPPYGRDGGDSNQELWSARLIEQYRAGITTEAVLLVNAVTDRKWFQPLWEYPICFTNHRIKFYNAETEAGQPTHGNALVYLGPSEKTNEFFRLFSQFGVIARKLTANDFSR